MSLNREANLARNTLIITFGKVCTQFVGFLLLPLYTAALNTEEYGIVDLILTYSSLAFPFITLSIDQSLFRFLIDERNNEKNKSEIISTSIYFVLLQSIVIAIAILVIRFITKKALLGYFLLVLLGTVWSFLTLQLSRGIGDNVGYSIGSTLAGVVQVICNIIFLVLFDLGIKGMLLATIAGNFSCTFLLFFRVHILRYMKFKNINIVLLKKMLKYSLPMIPNQLSWWALNASDKVIVQFFLGAAANGILAVSTKFSSVYVQFSNIFNISWTESATLHIKDTDAEVFISALESGVKLFNIVASTRAFFVIFFP
jgi:O-antigen/teichoic acid export membrane protein